MAGQRTGGKIKNWKRKQYRESKSVPYIWVNEKTGSEVEVEAHRDSYRVGTSDGWETGFTSKEDARKWAAKWMRKHPRA